jgi:gliding motility-associated lipoprotein GldD
MNWSTSILVLMVSVFVLVSCGGEAGDYYPKPRGYMRLDFPERNYEVFSPDSCPYQFEIPEYFKVADKANCNKDIIMDRFNATLFLTYQAIDSNLLMNIEYSRKLAYDHSIKADAIEEIAMIDPRRRAYGLKYNLKGDAASPYQFYVTDSTKHFLRGALYFNVKPNYDSVRTSLEYITEDLDNILETVRWK